MTDAFTILKTGNFFGSFLETFASVGIPIAFFYGMLLMAACLGIYLRTKSIKLVSLTLILLGSGLSSVSDQIFSKYFLIVIILGVAMAAYSIFSDRT